MIRNVPDEVQAGLQLRAKANGRTTAAEIRDILTAAAKPEGRDFIGYGLRLIRQEFEGDAAGMATEKRFGVTVEEKILKIFENRVLKYDLEAAQAYAAIIKDARRQKRSIGRQDAMVAAVAKSYGIRVACFDASPFLTAGVTCVEPWRF